MHPAQIRSWRLVNQQLAKPRFATARALVGWMGAMQAQEYAMARWAIALRVPGLTDSAVETAFDRGEILRTHVLRPTWHFVAPEDIRWMLALARPQINSINAYMHRQLGLNEQTFQRSNKILAKSLAGGRFLTRTKLQEELQRGKVIAAGHRLSYVMMRAEIDGIICSGPRDGKQFTYALLDERVPPTRTFSRENALARLAERYFRSRGPATVHDFSNWSGLSIKDACFAISSLSHEFSREEFSGKTYFFPPGSASLSAIRPTFLMPEYDEYGMSYKDLGAMWAKRPSLQTTESASDRSRQYCLIIEGQLAGWWRKDPKTKTARVNPEFLRSLTLTRRRAVERAIEKHQTFVASSKNPAA